MKANKRTEKLFFRCSPGFKEALEFIRNQSIAKPSDADIIHDAVIQAARQAGWCLYDGDAKQYIADQIAERV